jgi:hypothetical protein
MEVVENKVLTLRTRNPQIITDAIKKSAILEKEDDDVYTVAIHWGLDEMQTLATLPFKKPPSTIARDYEWTGKFTPFDHQKETASFLSLHKKAFCISNLGG